MNDSVTCASLSHEEARHSRQLYCVLVLLVTGRALGKVQGSGEGDGAAAVRAIHEQWEPCSRSRFTGDAQAAIEAFERCIREYEGPEHTRGT